MRHPHRLPLLMLIFGSLALAGCSTSLSKPTSQPATIGVLNSTDNHIQHIKFRALPTDGQSAARVGMIAPLPVGVTQLIGRGAEPRDLPKQGLLTWVDSQGIEYSQRVGKESLTNLASGEPGEILLIELHSDHKATLRYVLDTDSHTS